MNPEMYLEPDDQTIVIDFKDGKTKTVVQLIDGVVHLSLRREHPLDTIVNFLNGEASVCEVSRVGKEITTDIRLNLETIKAINEAVTFLKEH